MDRQKRHGSYERFEGVIGRTQAESTPWWPERPHPGERAPNVVLVLLDDTGFAQLGCFGSDMATPNIDRLAAEGLRYTNFHVTPLCSPTRAALLTGRDHHTVGMRSVSNFSSGYPHMRGHVSNHAATAAEVLRDDGYATFCVGKWHLCPMEDASAAGPFDQWPLQRGFDRFYGFMEGETDQFHPELVYDNHLVEPPATDGYHLTEDLVDRALGFVHDTVSIRPDRPFFLYLALGAMHAPHQAPESYLARWRGRFDDGWDAARDRWFARQQEMGLLPPGTDLAPRNPGVEPWDELPENHRLLAARLQEAFAAFLEHTDDQMGRLFAGLDRLGLTDDTLVVFLSDNGASQEGGPFGVLHEMKYFNLVVETPDEAVERLDDIGGPHSHANYPWGWAQAGNTPFKWYKQNTHEGGVHVPLIVRWPGGLPEGASGGLRHQFHHVTDLVPTIYDIAGVTPPDIYRGREQMPIAGVPLTYTFTDPDAPSTRTVQYFEMMGHRAIYADGWKAVTRHQPGVPFDDDVWELYHVEIDRSECHDLAAEMPEKVEELVALWWEEAEAAGVLPLDDRTIELFGARFRDHSPHPTSRHYTYRPPMSPLPAQVAPALGGRSWDLRATISSRPAGGGGVLYASGTETSGLSLFLDGDDLVFDYNCFGDHHVARSTRAVPEGASVVGVDLRRSGPSGTATVVIDDEPCGSVEIPFVMHMISSIGPSVGYDHGSPVSDLYAGPNPFVGVIDRIDVQLVRPGTPDAGSAEAEVDERSTMARQ